MPESGTSSIMPSPLSSRNPHSHTQATNLPSVRPTAMPQPIPTRRPRPGNVQTNFSSSHPSYTIMPPSAISASSVASSPQNISPAMSPETTLQTNNSSIQPSPEPSWGRSQDDGAPPPELMLGESVLGRKTSSSSLGYSYITSPMHEVGSLPPPVAGGILRRLSNKTTSLVNRRRQSSVAPNSREGSVGPAMVRKRSGSTTTANTEIANGCALGTDSDDSPDDRDDSSGDGASSILYANGSTASANGTLSPATTLDSTVIPSQLLNGTRLRKVSKKNRNKRINLALEPSAGRISWKSTRKSKYIRIDHIKDVRRDSDIRQYCRDFDIPESEEKRWFSIIYAAPELHKTKTLHLIADDMGTFRNWIDALEKIWQHRLDNLISLMSFDDKAIQEYWKTEVALQCDGAAGSAGSAQGEDEALDFPGFERVCRHLHINASRAQLQARFHAADRTNTGRMGFAKFREFISLIKTRTDIATIYSKEAPNPDRGLRLVEFLDLLRDVQGEDVAANEEKWRAIFLDFADKPGGGEAEENAHTTEEAEAEAEATMSDAALARFFTSSYNTPIIEAPAEYELDRPMNEYFISSSHNTYLTGRQVVGESSIEGYITALSEGCRCVEVDCWDGSDNQPVVLHGRAMTSSISFQEVMTTINKYAFERSNFPLWISLEVHTNPAQQARMATIIKETFGSRLVTEPLDASLDKLPSPKELMGRILIKVKKPQPKDEATGRRRGNSLTSPYARPVVLDNRDIPSQSLPQTPILSPSQSVRRLGIRQRRVNTIAEGEIDGQSSSGGSDTESIGEMQISEKLLDEKLLYRPEPENKTDPVLGDLGVYCAGVRFNGFDAPEAKAVNHIFSFMESSFAKYSRTKEQKKQLDRHNMRYLMRVYPDRTRFNSSNFDPLIYWRRGVQMAALNWQTFDHGMQLNRAMFEGGTDGSGYVLKPRELRQIQVLPEAWTGKRERKTVSFSIDVISAQKLMRPSGMPAARAVHPYIEVEVFHPNDKRYKSDTDGSLLGADPDTPLFHRTQIVPENGFNPTFDRKLNFKVTTKYPDLVFVKWSVKLSTDGESYPDRKTAPIATFTAKLSNLKRGYRTLPLYNRIGELYVFSTLFCHIKIDPITSILLDCPDDYEGHVPEPSSGKILRNVFGRSANSPKSSMEKATVEAT